MAAATRIRLTAQLGARAFDLAGLTAPTPGQAVPKSAGSLTAVFTLYASRPGAPLASRIARAIAAARDVRVTLAGSRIHPATGYCRWNATHGVFRCNVPAPPARPDRQVAPVLPHRAGKTGRALQHRADGTATHPQTSHDLVPVEDRDGHDEQGSTHHECQPQRPCIGGGHCRPADQAPNLQVRRPAIIRSWSWQYALGAATSCGRCAIVGLLLSDFSSSISVPSHTSAELRSALQHGSSSSRSPRPPAPRTG